MKTALFLGAGASVCFGKPTTMELLKALSARFENNKFVMDILNRNSFSDIEYLYTALNDIIHLEKSPAIPLLNTFYSENFGLQFKNFLPKLKQLRSDIRNMILDEYDITDKQTDDAASIYLVLYRLITMIRSKPLQVITTNYDTAFDNYARTYHNSNVVDGFKPANNNLKRIWSRNFEPLNDESIYLLKLHGSITWYRDGLKIFQIGDAHRRNEKYDVMISPTLTEKHYDVEPFKSLMEQFQKILDEIDVLIVIGFSFRDEKLTAMIKDTVEFRKIKIISISPTASIDINKQFKFPSTKLDPFPSSSQILEDLYFSFDIEFKHETIGKITSTLKHFDDVLSEARYPSPDNSP